jgi:uncharacterized membrane protein YphA (DoxX/SURF4 family)
MLLCVGLLVRLAAVPLAVDMLVAIVSTKVPILLGRGVFSFAAPPASASGIWSMLHEARTDLAMLLGCAFLLAVGAGAGALDEVLRRRERAAWRGWRDRVAPPLSEASRQ